MGLIVVVQVFIAEREGEHALADQGSSTVIEALDVAVVRSAPQAVANSWPCPAVSARGSARIGQATG